MTSTTNSKCCKPTRMPEAYSKLPRSNSILYRVYTMKGYSRKVTTSTEHSLNLVRKDMRPRRMTEISINEMIFKVNSLPFYDKFVEASVNVTDFSGRALLAQVIILLYRRKKIPCEVLQSRKLFSTYIWALLLTSRSDIVSF